MSEYTRKDSRARSSTDGASSSQQIPQLPQNLDAEKALLGSILLLPEVLDEVALVVKATDFYDDVNRRLFETMLAMHEEGHKLDLLLLVDRLKKADLFESIGGHSYLVELGQAVPTAAHATYYGRLVSEKAVLRALIHASLDIEKAAYDPAAEARDVLTTAEQKVFAVLENRSSAGQVLSIADVLQNALDRIDSRMDQTTAFGGVATGFADFDHMTGGLQKSELIILAARPSMGKTALAMNMAEYAALNGTTVLFVSLEMSALELADRLLCSVARVVDSEMARFRRMS
jgi:replicative DNA helicase